MHQTDFYELPRAVQDRFMSSISGEGQPRPLLVIRPGMPRTALLWLAVALVGALLLAVVVLVGFGNLRSSMAIQGKSIIGIYAALGSLISLSIMQVLATLRRGWSLPYRPGIYLFPVGVIDACDHVLKSYALSRLVSPAVGDKSLTLAFPEGVTFTFPLVVSGHSDEVKRTIEEAQAALEKAQASADKKSLGVLDPLVDIGVVNPFAPKNQIEKSTPLWARQVWVAGIVIGAVLAPGVWLVRNMVSDGRMLAEASKAGDPESLRAYLARGGTNGDVRDVLLPRAELARATKDGTVEAIEQFIVSHQSLRIQGEVSAALRQAMLTELEGVKKVGTVTALAEFGKRHSNNLVDAELRQAVHGVYQAALARYKKESGLRDPTVLAFVERLLTFAEKAGPRAEIRFRRKPTRSMEIADTQIKKSPFFMGVVSLPSQYFDDAHARPRTSAAAKTISGRFGQAFPPDIFALELGPAVLEAEGSAQPIRVPTMFIEHSVEMSGASYLSSNPRGVYVGLGMLFEVTFRIPDDAKSQKWRLSAWRPPDTTVPKGEGPYEGVVYEAMASEGFNQFVQRYLATFFAHSEPKGTN